MNTLLVSPFWGILWLVFLFFVCFFGVHLVKLARLGREYQKKNEDKKEEKSKPVEKSAEKAEQKPSPQNPAGEPIYYIVERKRKTKSSFSPPKEIKFK